MKKLLFILSITLSSAAFAQTGSLTFKVGTKFDYAMDFNGQDIEYDLTIKSMGDPLIFEWDVPSYGTGTYELSAKGLQSGTGLNFEQVQPGTATKLKDAETVILVSRDAFAGLKKTGNLNYMNLAFMKKTEASPLSITVKGSLLNLIHVVSVNGTVQLWILDNPGFPLLVQIQGNPLNINYTLKNIEN